MRTSDSTVLAREVQEELVALTRSALRRSVMHQPVPAPMQVVKLMRQYPELALPAGAFVTIYLDDHLRGCLGEPEPEDPLIEVVLRCASRVPVSDGRFLPVRPDELPRLNFKISVLSRPQPVEALDAIQLGVHGLIARHEGHGGLLLPEVPVEQGWDLKTFLSHLWRKAGIDARVPVDKVRLWSFTTQIIDSGDFAQSGIPDD